MLKKSIILPLFVVLSCAVGRAADPAAPASEASAKELLEVSHARQLLDNMLAQVGGMMKTQMQQATAGKTITPADQANMDKGQAKGMEVLKSELSWDKLEPMYVQVYTQSFTQSEVEGIVAFYKTPAGQALVNKMPAVMQNTSTIMQQRMAGLMPKMMAAMQESAASPEDAAQAAPSPAAGKKKGK